MIKTLLIIAAYIGLLEIIINFQQSKSLLIISCILLFFLSLISTFRLRILRQQGILAQLNISFLPVIYILSSTVFLVFVPADYSLQHAYIGICAFIFLFVISLTNKLIKDCDNRHSYQSCDFLITISAFLLYSSVFGLYLFLRWPSWAFMLLLALATFILTYEFFWYNKLFNKHIIYSLILTLIISEFSWALTLWPTGFISRAIVVFAVFYAFTILSKHHFKHTINNKNIISIIIISVIIVALALVTTKWTF